MRANESRDRRDLKSRCPIGRAPIRPDRIRSIGGEGFAFIPNRFLREGFFSSLTPDELRLYLLLILASDRSGHSFYHYDSLCSILEVSLEAYLDARGGLLEKDLIAYDGTRIQVLSIPRTPKQRSSRGSEIEERAPEPETPPRHVSEPVWRSSHEIEAPAPDVSERCRAILASLRRRDS